MKRRRHTTDDAPQTSLVPLADLLANTVGIAVFILAFTILASMDFSITKKMPFYEKTNLKPISVFCTGGQIYVAMEDAVNDFTEPFGKPDTGDIVSLLNSRRIMHGQFSLSGEMTPFGPYLHMEVRPSLGENFIQIQESDSQFQKFISSLSKSEKYIRYFVSPDSVDIFRAARNLAQERGYRYIWFPRESNSSKFDVPLGRGGGGGSGGTL